MAADVTAKTGIELHAEGSAQDFRVINENYQKIDNQLGFFECTSTTRPSTPFIGQHIMETDTNRTYRWCGGSIGWYKTGGKGKIVISTTGNNIPATQIGLSNGVYHEACASAEYTAEWSGLIRVTASTSWTMTGNCAGYWRLAMIIAGAEYFVALNDTEVIANRIGNGGNPSTSLNGAGVITATVSIQKGQTFKLKVYATCDPASAGPLYLNTGGSFLQAEMV